MSRDLGNRGYRVPAPERRPLWQCLISRDSAYGSSVYATYIALQSREMHQITGDLDIEVRGEKAGYMVTIWRASDR